MSGFHIIQYILTKDFWSVSELAPAALTFPITKSSFERKSISRLSNLSTNDTKINKDFRDLISHEISVEYEKRGETKKLESDFFETSQKSVF